MTKRILAPAAILAIPFAVWACSSSDDKTPASETSGRSDAGATTTTPPTTGTPTTPTVDAGGTSSKTVTGTIASKAFTLASAAAHFDDEGKINLVLSNTAGICESMTANKLHAGEAIVQFYQLEGMVPGTFTSPDQKYAAVADPCASGSTLDDNATASGATTATVTITAKTDTSVTGTIDVTYEDGSSVKGSFTAPVCDGELEDSTTCL